MDVNELFRQLEEELKRGNYTREQKMAIIKNAGDIYKNKIDNELKNELAKQIPNNTSRTPDIARDYVGMTSPTYSGSYDKNSQVAYGPHTTKAVAPDLAGPKPAVQEPPINSINPYLPNNNLPERVNSNATVGIQSAIDNFVKSDFNIPQQNTKKENFGIQKPFELRVEKQKMPNGEIIDVATLMGKLVTI